jgi:hypothetical protein
MAKHIYRGITAPSFAPAQVGHHYVDTVNRVLYISVGTASPSDWIPLNGFSAVEKAGVVPAINFSGDPKTASVVFDNPFVDNNYAVNITGVDNRNWSASNLTINGFTINTNANRTLVSQVFWSAIHSGS